MNKRKFDIIEGLTNMLISSLFLANLLKLISFDWKLFMIIWLVIILMFSIYRFFEIKGSNDMNLLKSYGRYIVANGIIIFSAYLMSNIVIGWIGIGSYVCLGLYGYCTEYHKLDPRGRQTVKKLKK